MPIVQEAGGLGYGQRIPTLLLRALSHSWSGWVGERKSLYSRRQRALGRSIRRDQSGTRAPNGL